jgi:hypothetical protein
MIGRNLLSAPTNSLFRTTDSTDQVTRITVRDRFAPASRHVLQIGKLLDVDRTNSQLIATGIEGLHAAKEMVSFLKNGVIGGAIAVVARALREWDLPGAGRVG